mmetsp:Transcript_16116/g.30375  ORF Transcript_16116/g.30375 Transcript_16116/m.30375 type:complete len:226 (+) Transcript_16116:237-914(+)
MAPLFLAPATTTANLLLLPHSQLLLPPPPHALKQIHTCPGIIHRTMCLPLHLYPLPQLLIHQIPQLPRPQLPPAPTRRPHKRLILRRIPSMFPRMRQHQRRQIVLQCVSHQHLVLQQLLHLRPTFLVIQRGIVRHSNIFWSHSRHERAKVRHAFRNADEGVEQDGAVPVYRRGAGKGGLFAVGAHADHLAIDGDVSVFFGGGEGVIHGGLFGEFGGEFLVGSMLG